MPSVKESLRLSEEDLRKLEIPLGKKSRTYRFFEILPGFLSYFVVALPLLIGIWRADVAGFLILLFMLIWFFRTAAMAAKALGTLRATQAFQGTKWFELLKEDFYGARDKLDELEKKKNLSRLEELRKNCLSKYVISNDQSLTPEDLIHVVMVPMVKEPYEVVQGAVLAAANQNYDVKNRVILQLCTEERAKVDNAEVAKRLEKEFKDKFLNFVVTEHPAGLPDELIGKGRRHSGGQNHPQRGNQARNQRLYRWWVPGGQQDDGAGVGNHGIRANDK
jgi:hypothetical protein